MLVDFELETVWDQNFGHIHPKQVISLQNIVKSTNSAAHFVIMMRVHFVEQCHPFLSLQCAYNHQNHCWMYRLMIHRVIVFVIDSK